MVTNHEHEDYQAQIDEALTVQGSNRFPSTKWPGMTYEQGVIAALEWVIGKRDEPPMSEE